MYAIAAAHDGDIQMIDSTSVRAHQQTATTLTTGMALGEVLRARGFRLICWKMLLKCSRP